MSVRESRVREGTCEVVTLHMETTTPRRRTLTESFRRQCTPSGEVPEARLKRHSVQSSARSRAMCRLQPDKHRDSLAERKRKRDAVPKTNRAANPPFAPAPAPATAKLPVRDPVWQRCEVDRQIADAEERAPPPKITSPRLLEEDARYDWAGQLRFCGIEEEVVQEVLSGTDVETLRRKYPGLARYGGMAPQQGPPILLAGMQRAIANTRSRCRQCAACLAKAEPRKRGLNFSGASLPCEWTLEDMSYTDSEREALYAFLCEQRPDHAYGFPSHEDLHAYILPPYTRGVEV